MNTTVIEDVATEDTETADLLRQLADVVSDLHRNTGLDDLTAIVERGHAWTLGPNQNLFRALESYAWLAGLPQLPAAPGRADAGQRTAFAAAVTHAIATSELPADRPRDDKGAEQFLAEYYH